MCYIDLEPCSVFNETPRKARKAHRCSSCHGAIMPESAAKWRPMLDALHARGAAAVSP